MWRVIDAERAGVADLLAGLTDEQWERPSLCAGWRVREVAAHLGLAPRARLGWTLVEAVRAGGGFNRMIDNTARREAARRSPERLTAELREASGSRHLAPGQKLGYAMLDVLVHGQDIAVPLGIDRAMPPEAALSSAEITWRIGFPFHARRRLRGVRLTATDVAWAVGDGPEVSGPIAALLLLLTGRDGAALARLDGPGVAALTGAESHPSGGAAPR
ncbi:maleylpyruvate isomerase family mycothiol-dependent enzyme [Actinomadura decatromicini]|uniref:Maleylpyruvate isomerase family mycothiol-dependent enzyme n=1 Tax=Actinomadura decatromicini TaxID=2604572 RepID=A0A5D3FZY2_9ACTN|nr:maleylpyruvate isomerase family mycothiol-dependent enzyme [Actinomadura decatromicini]TYK53538.1 maleylpyruvate isomerase family mycothiol-dependent enzyme [Actinomadura decatromicini]